MKEKTIVEKVKTMLKTGLIDKNRKDEIHKLTYAAKKARNFVSHDIKIYIDPNDALILLANAIKFTEIYEKFLKFKENKGN